MREALDGFLFADGNAHYLGAVRVAFFALMMFSAWSRNRSIDYAQLYGVVPGMWKPVSFFRAFDSPPFRAALARSMRGLVFLWYAAMLLAMSGLLFPLGNISAALLCLWVLGYQHQFGKIDHARATLPIFALVLSCAPADAWTTAPLFEVVSMVHGYHWPIALGQVLVSMVWFGAGVSKIRHGGFEWVFSNNLSVLWRLHVMDYYFRPPVAPRLTVALASHPRLCQLGAAGAVVIELLFPLALLGGWFAAILVPASLALVASFRIIQGPRFVPLFVLTVLCWAYPLLTP